MKRKILTALIVGLVALFTLVSCGGGGGNTTPPDNGNTPSGGAVVFEPGMAVRIIRSETNSTMNISDITNKLVELTGKMPNTFLDGSEAQEHEIVIGDTSRPISQYAKEYAEGLDMISNETGIFVIYAYRNSVAIWWSHEIDALANDAMAKFIERFMASDTLSLKDGPVYYGTFDRAAHEAAREAALREEQLDGIEAILGKDARDAIADYLKIFRPEYYEWLANLYDPGTGGFYYSNSGRDTEGFLPDIESTVQALNWIAGNGMLEKYNNNLAEGIPQWMQEQVLAYAISLQSPIDGYFYHPQWGANVQTSRISRDLGWATQIIKKFGGQVLYDAPNGDKGSEGPPPGVAPTSALTTPLGSSVVNAVSKVVSTSTTHLPAHLQSTAAFESYLRSFDYAESSYPAGNTITSQNSQILNAGPEFVAVFEKVLNEKQEEAQEKLRDAAEAEARKNNPAITAAEIAEVRTAAQNGLWETRVSFDSVNGLMKISSAYNGLGVKMPYAKEAIESAIQMVYQTEADVEGKKPTNSVDVYNPWVSLQAIVNNVNNYYSKEEGKTLRAIITENAADMIRITQQKVSIFAKDDGSYGYTNSKVPARSQGAPVAVEGTIEGDINGGGIATNGTFGSMCGALGISKPNLYFNSDYEKFIAIIESLGPVEKVPIVRESEPVTFDDEDLGEEAPMRINASMNGGYVRVVKDDREGATGNVLEYSTVAGTGQTITTPLIGSGVGNCLVLEWDMNIKSSQKNTVVFQIRLGEAYMFTVRTGSSSYTLGDSSSTTATVSVTNEFAGSYNYDTWYTFRIEHYTGTADTTKTLIYVNGEKVGESNNYFGRTRPDSVTPTPVPNDRYDVGRFYALYSADMIVHFDNIRAEKIAKSLDGAANTEPTAYIAAASDEEAC